MVWGSMMAGGVGIACQIEGTMTGEMYTDILDTHLRETFDKFEIDGDNYIFQHDNDPKHTSKKAQQWLEDNDIEVPTWPAQSPDLNLIEHLWAIVKRRLARYDTPPKGTAELWDRFCVGWDEISEEECMKLVESMPRRIAAVLEAKGKWTRY